jgi:hypothetical protein
MLLLFPFLKQKEIKEHMTTTSITNPAAFLSAENSSPVKIPIEKEMKRQKIGCFFINNHFN